MSEQPTTTKLPWIKTVFVDNTKLGGSHKTFRVSAQRGPYGTLFEQDADLILRAVNSHQALVDAGSAFHEATERLLDWMNGNDLSADHAEQKPADFQALSSSLVAFADALKTARGESQ